VAEHEAREASIESLRRDLAEEMRREVPRATNLAFVTVRVSLEAV